MAKAANQNPVDVICEEVHSAHCSAINALTVNMTST